jgi:hypothetical protein
MRKLVPPKKGGIILHPRFVISHPNSGAHSANIDLT